MPNEAGSAVRVKQVHKDDRGGLSINFAGASRGHLDQGPGDWTGLSVRGTSIHGSMLIGSLIYSGGRQDGASETSGPNTSGTYSEAPVLYLIARSTRPGGGEHAGAKRGGLP
jgi:hypothetical protein